MTKEELKEKSEKSHELMHRICVGEFELACLKDEFMQVMNEIKEHFINETKKNLENEKKNKRSN